ncbi:hypothetical protein, partial [Klebsiella electrica]|uniref:hypothetical protein n=1 Tax=Klebsiella electrica TaxID=1259973 RepID=UPI003F758193
RLSRCRRFVGWRCANPTYGIVRAGSRIARAGQARFAGLRRPGKRKRRPALNLVVVEAQTQPL